MDQARIIQLPRPDTRGRETLEATIARRRSVRDFRKKKLELAEISQLLWAAQGITKGEGLYGYRASPSAGAMYPMEIYAATEDGLFHYRPVKHDLVRCSDVDERKRLAKLSLDQSCISQAPLDLILCTVYSRVTSKYGKHGVMYTHIEVGHVAQNVHLQAVAMGLGSVPIGAFEEEKVAKALALPADHEPLYIIPVGHPLAGGK